jgi:hypothetical protein
MTSDKSNRTELLIGGESVRGAGAPLAVENPFTTAAPARRPAPPMDQVARRAAGVRLSAASGSLAA